MKKYLVSTFFLILGWFCTTAQSDVLDDFWKNIEKRKLLMKEESDSLTTKYESQILSACGGKIIFLQQDYVYEKKDKRYVRGGDDYYGRSYGIGVAGKDGVITSKHLYEPWNTDKSVLSSKGYYPVRTVIQFRPLLDTILSLKEEGNYVITAGESLIRYSFIQQAEAENKIPQPDSSGLLILFYHDMNNDSVWEKIIPLRPLWVGGTAIIDSQWMHQLLIGGLYINTDTAESKPVYIITAILSGQAIDQFKLVKLSENVSMKSSGKSSDTNRQKGTSSQEYKSTSDEAVKKYNIRKAKKCDEKKGNR